MKTNKELRGTHKKLTYALDGASLEKLHSRPYLEMRAIREQIENELGIESADYVPAGKRQREQPDASFDTPRATGATASDAYRSAFDSYIRHGIKAMPDDEKRVLRAGWEPVSFEKRAQTIGTPSAGGFAVPDELMADLEENLLAFGGLRGSGAITILRTSGGNDLPVPQVDDTSNGAGLLSENTQASDVDATFSQTVLSAFKFSSGIIKVSSEFMMDAAIDVPGWATQTVATRILRGLAPYLINGDGVNEPGGLDLAGSFVTAANASSITRQDVVDLIHAVDPAYRASPDFRLVLGDSALKAIKELSFGSSDDRPLWQPSMREGAPDRIEGVPYVVDQGVQDVGAGNHCMYAGDLSKFWLREAGGLRILRLDERYADLDVVAFVAFARFDSDIMASGTDPIVYLRNPAS